MEIYGRVIHKYLRIPKGKESFVNTYDSVSETGEFGFKQRWWLSGRASVYKPKVYGLNMSHCCRNSENSNIADSLKFKYILQKLFEFGIRARISQKQHVTLTTVYLCYLCQKRSFSMKL